jgi:hypothetical protein
MENKSEHSNTALGSFWNPFNCFCHREIVLIPYLAVCNPYKERVIRSGCRSPWFIVYLALEGRSRCELKSSCPFQPSSI